MLKLIDILLHLMLLIIPFFLCHSSVFFISSLLIFKFLFIVLYHLIEAFLSAIFLFD